jgi:hypothetical protein
MQGPSQALPCAEVLQQLVNALTSGQSARAVEAAGAAAAALHACSGISTQGAAAARQLALKTLDLAINVTLKSNCPHVCLPNLLEALGSTHAWFHVQQTMHATLSATVPRVSSLARACMTHAG